MQRRFLPLVVVLGIAVTALLARLWDVQVVQHRVWAREAANLVRSAAVDPYRRGDILDRHGRVLVRDEETYALEFVWREFRRGHPLGQVAMMRSLVLMRPVGLDEARMSLADAALSYASLSPDDLDRFARGGELDAGVDYVPAIAAESESERLRRARDDRRRSRAGDLRYYLTRLLGLSPRDARTVNERIEDDGGGELSFLELSAWVLDRSPVEVRDRLRGDVLEADQHLSRLALLIDWEEDAARANSDPSWGVLAPGDRLVALMEARRSQVEDESARELFRRAAGVSPVRLDAGNLRAFDLEWIRTALDWDRLRLEEWIERTGGAFDRSITGWLAAHTIARMKIDGAAPADRVVSAFAHAFRRDAEVWSRRHAAPEDWRAVTELCVIPALQERLRRGDRIPEDAADRVLPFQRDELHTAAIEGEPLLRAVFGPDVDASSLVEIASNVGGDWSAEDEALVGDLLLRGHRTVQRRAREVLAELRQTLDEDESIEFSRPYVEKALETRRYVIRDRGARPRVVGKEPPIDLVLLVTRYPGAFAGFSVTSKMRRMPVAFHGRHSTPVASGIVGRVRSPFLVEVLRQRPGMEELSEFQRKLELPEEDRREILRLVARGYQRDEMVGGSGIEAWFDAELSGTSGYREVHGLQDRVDGNRAPIRVAATDGEDVQTTLDLDLQRAALNVLEFPDPPPVSDTRVDERWMAKPVGAIVLATTDGRILAAASVPTVGDPEPDEFADGERKFAIDRSLLRPRSQPPGSVVKPLLASYALQHLGLNPNLGLEPCHHDRPRQGTSPKRGATVAGFGMIDCNSSMGHSHKFGMDGLPLSLAIEASCNVYFAALGERYYNEAAMRDAYRTFGFGEPTGVLFDDSGARQGLRDSYWFAPGSPLREDAPGAGVNEVARQYLGNGLVYVDVNVVQVARAYAGLATGRLPVMRLVERVGGREIAPRSEPLGIDEANLELVRAAVRGVVASKRGSAHKKGLSDEELKFALAAKTGSADYRRGRFAPGTYGRGGDGTGMRKHTWLAGWFPADEPRFVLAVYLHDTSATASHSAVYIAGQFLKSDAVQRLMAEAETEAGH